MYQEFLRQRHEFLMSFEKQKTEEQFRNLSFV